MRQAHVVLDRPNPGDRVRHVYFPADSFISLITPIDHSAALEVGLIGNEGMVGIPLLLGVEVSERRALVQGGGPALRMSAAQFRRELRRSSALQRRLARYACVRTILDRRRLKTVSCGCYQVDCDTYDRILN